MRGKKAYFDRWCLEREVENDYKRLKQLILMEKFKSGLSEQLKCYVVEKRVESAHELAILADEYTPTNKKHRIRPNYANVSGGQNTNPGRNDNIPGGNIKQKNNRQLNGEELQQVTCSYCGKVGHISTDCEIGEMAE